MASSPLAPNKSTRGFSLVSVIVSLAILTIVSLSALAIMSRAARVADSAQRVFEANNVAREGLELVRVIRDNQWFSGEEDWIPPELCDEFTLDAAAVRNNDSPGPSGAAALAIQPNGEWQHAPGDPTGYSRTIQVDCDQIEAEVPTVTVTSTVTWQEEEQTKNVILKEKLVDWLPRGQTEEEAEENEEEEDEE